MESPVVRSRQRGSVRGVDPFSVPPSTPMSVVIPDAPHKRRTGRMIAIAVVALAAIGGVAFAVTRGDAKPTYSLKEATDATVEVKSLTFTTTTEGFGSKVSAEAESDVENGLVHITMDLGTDVVGVGGEIEMILDIQNKLTYINQSFFKKLGVPIDTEWLSMDEAYFEQNGQDSIFNGADLGNPLDAAVALDKAIKTEEIGFDEVNGLKVKHYRVTFRGADVFAADGQLGAQLDEVNGEIPDEIVYEFYIDEQNLVRRVTFQVDVGSGEVTTDIVVRSINEPVDIKVPDESDVTDARDFL